MAAVRLYSGTIIVVQNLRLCSTKVVLPKVPILICRIIARKKHVLVLLPYVHCVRVSLVPAHVRSAVPTSKLVIGFGALYSAWGDKSCDGPGGSGIHQTGCLNKSLAACKDAGVQHVALFELNAFGCGTHTVA